MSTDTDGLGGDFPSEIPREPESPPATAEQLQQLSDVSPDDSGKWPTHQKLFTHRLRREGKYAEYTARVKELAAQDKATGGSGMYPKAMKAAAKEFNFLGAEGERLMAQQFIDTIKNPIIGHIPSRAVTFEERKNRSFEAILATMPDKAARMTELEWIRHHPAMTRKARKKGAEKMKDVTLNVPDLKGAPSKAAVIELQHWCNAPQEFFKKVLGETVKQKEEIDSTKRKYDVQVDVAEIEKLLRELTGGVV